MITCIISSSSGSSIIIIVIIINYYHYYLLQIIIINIETHYSLNRKGSKKTENGEYFSEGIDSTCNNQVILIGFAHGTCTVYILLPTDSYAAHNQR